MMAVLLYALVLLLLLQLLSLLLLSLLQYCHQADRPHEASYPAGRVICL